MVLSFLGLSLTAPTCDHFILQLCTFAGSETNAQTLALTFISDENNSAILGNKNKLKLSRATKMLFSLDTG